MPSSRRAWSGVAAGDDPPAAARRVRPAPLDLAEPPADAMAPVAFPVDLAAEDRSAGPSAV